VIVHVDADAPTPVFEQLRSQLERLIVSGQLAEGARLPTVRQLAVDLSLARGTVNKVYEQLARDGLVATAGRHGTTVLPVARRRAPTSADVEAAADTLALVVRQLGLADDAAHRALDRALRRW